MSDTIPGDVRNMMDKVREEVAEALYQKQSKKMQTWNTMLKSTLAEPDDVAATRQLLTYIAILITELVAAEFHREGQRVRDG